MKQEAKRLVATINDFRLALDELEKKVPEALVGAFRSELAGELKFPKDPLRRFRSFVAGLGENAKLAPQPKAKKRRKQKFVTFKHEGEDRGMIIGPCKIQFGDPESFTNYHLVEDRSWRTLWYAQALAKRMKAQLVEF